MTNEERDATLRAFIIGDLMSESGKMLTPDIVDTLVKQILKSIIDVIDKEDLNA